jgi:hypothetical protein
MKDKNNFPFIALVLPEDKYDDFSEKARRMYMLKGLVSHARIKEHDSYIDVWVELRGDNKPFPEIRNLYVSNVVPLVERIPFQGRIQKGPGYEAFKQSFLNQKKIGIGLMKEGKGNVMIMCQTTDVRIKSM